MDADKGERKVEQGKIEADRKTEQEKMAADLLARMDAEKEYRKAYLELMVTGQENRAAKQEEMLAIINAKMDATIESIQSEVREAIHKRVENVREELIQKTEVLQMELKDEKQKTKIELQTVEIAIYQRSRYVDEDIAAIKKDITANKKQIEQFKAIAERGGRPTLGAKHSPGANIRREIIVEHIPASVRDCSGAQYVVGQGKIHILNHGVEGPGRRRASRHSYKYDLRR
jgi:hypothetical protein